MIERAVHAGVPFSWVAGDEVYGGNPGLREWLEKEEVSYVLAVACDEIAVPAGPRRADALAALVPAAGWQRLLLCRNRRDRYRRTLMHAADRMVSTHAGRRSRAYASSRSSSSA